MSLSESLIAELEREAKATERILERVPADKVDWRPHAKSMSLGDLAWHIARMPVLGVIGLREGKRETAGTPAVQREGTDFAGEFRRNLEALKSALAAASDDVLLKEKFSFLANGQPINSMPKLGFIRTVIMNHAIHHRGQLSVYLRLLDVPVPATYGRSADENLFAR